jgi:hypothetical protein
VPDSRTQHSFLRRALKRPLLYWSAIAAACEQAVSEPLHKLRHKILYGFLALLLLVGGVLLPLD